MGANVLIENSANVNSTEEFGSTALHYAAWKNNVAVAEVLIENSANVDSTDEDGETALHRAASQASVDVAKLLIAHFANLDATAVCDYYCNYKGYTPLQVAYERKSRLGWSRNGQEMVELLRNA